MSPTSVCYAVTKAESGDETVQGAKTRASNLGKKAGSSVGGSSTFQMGIRKQAEKVSDLKVSRDSHRIRKQPLPLPQVQYRPPIIIHTYAPKVIHTQPDDFMSLVQKLTGSSDTRLRLKRKPAKKLSPTAAAAGATPASGRRDDQHDVAGVASAEMEQQGSKTAQCASPTSSEDDSSFLASDAGDSSLGLKQSHSPRSPLTNFDFENPDLMFTPFDGSSSNSLFSHVKAEPSFSFNDTSFNSFAESFTSKPGSTKQQAQPQAMHQPAEYSPFHSNIDINAPLGPFLPSMAGLSDLAPASTNWSQSLLDCFTGAPGSFTNQSQILRQRFSGGYTPSSEGTMVALENIQAFMLS